MTAGSPTSPVTVVVSRRAAPGRESDLEAWFSGVVDAAGQFPGHLGAEVYRPAPPENLDHVLVFRFATHSDLQRWNDSPERAAWLAKAEPLSQGQATAHALSGLEAWFPLQFRPGPPRWKMALLTFAVIYVLILALNATAGALLSSLTAPVRAAVSAAVLVPTMTWVAMPIAVRLFRPWLYH